MGELTVQDVVDALGRHPGAIALASGVAPLLVLLLRALHGKGGGERSPWRWCHAALVFAACIPGMAAVAIALSTALSGPGLLATKVATLVLYAGPIASMALTLALIGKTVDLDRVPGFDRLSALMAIFGVVFLAIFMLARIRIWVFASLWTMIAFGLFLYTVLTWGVRRLVRAPGEAREPVPRLPPA